MAQMVDESANFVFVQLIEQEPGIYDKRHPEYARRDKKGLVWERISHEMKASGIYTYITILTYILESKMF
jgi:hypothetical protein